VVYLADCVEVMRLMPDACVDVVFADPPYRLSGGGVTVKSGRVASVDKGKWDRSLGSFEKDHEWNVRWLQEARRILKPDGTLWVTGTHHIIFSLGFALQTLNFRIINNLIWYKPDPVPNALHTAFTHAHETLLWASRSHSSRHTFNYGLSKERCPPILWAKLPSAGVEHITYARTRACQVPGEDVAVDSAAV
jgi:site-specific DNA-methyltransferase (adenine-specific)